MTLNPRSVPPIQYRQGHVTFGDLQFATDSRALIPRFETQVLVQRVVDWCARHPTRRRWQIADIGTGSGIIAVSLAVALPNADIFATDISPEALDLAQFNATRHEVAERITFRQGDLLTPIPEPLDILVANLPYLPAARLATLDPGVREHEPHRALDGGPDGFALYRQLIEQLAHLEKKPQFCIFEIDEDQAPLARATLAQTLPQAQIEISPDASGLIRYLTLTL